MLSDFFRINLPYGICKNANGEWFAFNREYMPIGWNSTAHMQSKGSDDCYAIPIYTRYYGLSEKKLLSIAGTDVSALQRNEAGEIEKVFLYNDRTNPKNSSECWNEYFDKIKLLSGLEVLSARHV